VTAESAERKSERYAEFLKLDGLAGARIGVLREMSDDTADPDVIARLDEAVADLRRLGATVVDPVALPPDEDPPGPDDAPCNPFAFEIAAYLASLGPDAPVKNVKSILDSDNYHPSIEGRLRRALESELPGHVQPGCQAQALRDEKLRARVRAVLTEHDLGALIYPTWDNPPRLIGDLNTPHGNNSWQLSPPTGFPAISVPMGYVRDTLPVGLQLLGDAWSEGTLIAYAYAYEQGTRHRRPPVLTPGPVGARVP